MITSVRLLNRDELLETGQRVPVSRTFRMGIEITASGIESAALVEAYRALQALSPEAASILRRAARWLWKANSDENPHDSFLALWIAFNILYGPYERTGEQQAIQDFLASALPDEAAAQRLLLGLRPNDLALLAASGLTLRLRRGRRPIADELQAALGPPTTLPDRNLVTLAYLVVYAVRCDLVHHGGAALSPRDKERRLMWACVYALKPLILRVFRQRLGL